MTRPSDTAFAWWSRLRHQGLLLSPVVMLERYPAVLEKAPFWQTTKLSDARTRFHSAMQDREKRHPGTAPVLAWVDSLFEGFLGHTHIARQGSIPSKFSVTIQIGSRSEILRPHRVVYAGEGIDSPALLIMADTSQQVGRGRGRNEYARFLELLRASGQRLGLLTNGFQFRLVYAGLDFESWCEWESERWFDEGEGTEELLGLRQLLGASKTEKPSGLSILLDAVEESRKRQADLSNVLRENVRQAVEKLLEEVSAAARTDTTIFTPLVNAPGAAPLTDTEAHDALMQAAVRMVMRMVVCLFAESRKLLPVGDPVYDRSYGVRTLYELLDETIRHDGGSHNLMGRSNAWPRLMALFRLIHGGSAHGNFPLRAYGGALFRPGDHPEHSGEPVARALRILEQKIHVSDAAVVHVLRKLLRGPLPVLRGRVKTFVEGPVDYTDLRTEFIGLIYEGLLDYRIKRTTEASGPLVFLNLGREPVLPLATLERMLHDDSAGLKDLLNKLRKEAVTASVESEEEDSEEDASDAKEEKSDESGEPVIESDEPAIPVRGNFLDADAAAKSWARAAVKLAALVGKQKAKEPDSTYAARVEEEAKKLIHRVVPTGEFYLVRAGNTRKGTGTFYTRPQLAVPTAHRTLEPLCYDKSADGVLIPKTPEVILALKVVDPACGSASFLVAALHYLTEALYRSLCHHRNLEDPAQAKNLTLPFGRPRTGKGVEELVPFAPDDPQRGHTFKDRVVATLRRHVVERCIYGVDLNPLAIEFARVSLWIETLDPEMPMTFLDHKLKVGNALVGCWLDRVLDYPLRAWERNGGDDPDAKTPGPRTQRIKAFIKGTKDADGRPVEGIVKVEMRELIRKKYAAQDHMQFIAAEMVPTAVVAAARADYEQLHDMPAFNVDEREHHYREKVLKSPALNQLRRACDEWCALWFWPADEQSLALAPTPLHFHEPKPQRDALVERVRGELRFFHWELEFPDVFTPQRSGFDGVLGNPPWENEQPNPNEFFTSYDPLFRMLGRLESENRVKELYATVPELESRWLGYNGYFKAFANWVAYASDPFGLKSDTSSTLGRGAADLVAIWKKHRVSKYGNIESTHAFVFQTGRIFTYKLFLEIAFHLLNSNGRMGNIVPSGLYTDSWSLPLRTLFLDKCNWEWLFCFENKKKIFDIHGSFKFVAIVVDRQSTNAPMKAAFMVHDLESWERNPPPVLILDRSLIPLFSPKSRSIPEVRTQRDLDICRTIYENSIRIGDNQPGGTIEFALEFMMNTDAKLFPPIEKWTARGFERDNFGCWRAGAGDTALPLCEGRMIDQFDFSQKGWVRGKGRTAVWHEIPFENKQPEPQFLMSRESFAKRIGPSRRYKLGFMDVTSATNTRTFISAALVDVPCGNKVPTLGFENNSLVRSLALSACCNSLTCDFVTRTRLGGITFNWFIVEEIPIIKLDLTSATAARLVTSAARLTYLNRRFAPEWLRLKSLYPELSTREWKHWWAVTEADRLRLRVELDALCADAYGLLPDDFDWIVRDDPTDPKGFWRVDKTLPYRERLTDLAAAAFRALKEGKWSADSAASLSNDAFFALLGIPELTRASACHAEGLEQSLILKRPGCHRWEPETFASDDPRHGWTWEHCHADAVALLGSEQAVADYVGGKQEQTPAKMTEDEEFKLKGEGPRQGRLFE